MPDDITAQADEILETALAATGARDPREFYREQLRELKRVDPDGYQQAVEYYQGTLIPSVASGDAESLAAWTEYGRKLAESLTRGRTVSIDPTGRSLSYEAPSPPDRLVLHLPDENGRRALLVGLPRELSSAQRATYDVLVSGKQKTR